MIPSTPGSILKDKAKEKLNGSYMTLIMAGLLISLISGIVSSLVMLFFPMTNIPTLIIGEIAAFIVSIFTGVFSVGNTYLHLTLARDEEISLGDIFYGFKNNLQTSLKLSAILGFVASLPTFTYLFLRVFFYMTGKSSLVDFVGFVGVSYLISIIANLFLSQTIYILIDHPEYTIREILSTNWEILYGNKKRLLFLMVSFLPIILLGCVSIVGMFWVMPYIDMTLALFYLDISKDVPNSNYNRHIYV